MRSTNISKPGNHDQAFSLRYWLNGPLGRKLTLLAVTSMLLGAVEIFRLNQIAQLVQHLSGDAPVSTNQFIALIVVFCLVQPALYLAVIYQRNIGIDVESFNDISRGVLRLLWRCRFMFCNNRAQGRH